MNHFSHLYPAIAFIIGWNARYFFTDRLILSKLNEANQRIESTEVELKSLVDKYGELADGWDEDGSIEEIPPLIPNFSKRREILN